LAGAIAH